MTIRARLALGLFAIAVVLLAPLAYNVFSLRQFSGETRRLNEGVLGASLMVSRIRSDLDEVRRTEQVLNATRTDTAADTMQAKVRHMMERADSLRAFALDTAADTLRQLGEQISASIPRYQRLLATDAVLRRRGGAGRRLPPAAH